MEGLAEALGLSNLTILVQDWGGPFGLGYAGRRPERIRSVGIGNTFAWPATLGMKGFSYVMGNPVTSLLITRRNSLAWWLIPAGIERTLTEQELAAYWSGPLRMDGIRLLV